MNPTEYTPQMAVTAILEDVHRRTGVRYPCPTGWELRDAVFDIGHAMAALGVGAVDADTGQPVPPVSSETPVPVVAR
jgi:hypothetical protein